MQTNRRARGMLAGVAMVMAVHSSAAEVGEPIQDLQAELITVMDARSATIPPNSDPAEPVNYEHQPLPEAPVIRSDPETRELNATLTAEYATHSFTTFRNGSEVTEQLFLRSYNGELVGPTLVARPGDTLKIRVENHLPPEIHPPHCDDHGHCDHNVPHYFNTTNLHTHGLHVDPSGVSDNIFIRIAPGETVDYEIHIPDDHVAGTFWYHAHVHGSSTVQVGSGMAGALIIEGEYDETPRLKDARKRMIVFQEIAFDREGRIEGNQNYSGSAWNNNAAERGWHISLNGSVMPEIRMQTGEVELWRMVHSGVGKLMNLRLVSACGSEPAIPLIQVAADGIPLDTKRLREDRSVILAPAYRSDVAVRSHRPGVYYLIDMEDQAASDPLPESYCDFERGGGDLVLDEHAQSILARVVVEGPVRHTFYPRNEDLAQLPRPESISDSELSGQDQLVEFDLDLSGEHIRGFMNGRAFDPDSPRVLTLGEAQTWRLSSAFAHHPFHMHINPFEVIERDENGDIVDRYWKDTILVRQDNSSDPGGNDVELRMRYARFTGEFVAHCHLLDHGDHGMMEKIIVEP